MNDVSICRSFAIAAIGFSGSRANSTARRRNSAGLVQASRTPPSVPDSVSGKPWSGQAPRINPRNTTPSSGRGGRLPSMPTTNHPRAPVTPGPVRDTHSWSVAGESASSRRNDQAPRRA